MDGCFGGRARASNSSLYGQLLYTCLVHRFKFSSSLASFTMLMLPFICSFTEPLPSSPNGSGLCGPRIFA
jgi:hypothetical protein